MLSKLRHLIPARLLRLPSSALHAPRRHAILNHTPLPNQPLLLLLSPSHRSITFLTRIGSLRHLPWLVGGSLASLYSFVHYKVVGTVVDPYSCASFTSPALLQPFDSFSALLYFLLATTAWVDQQIDAAKSTLLDVATSVSSTLSPLQASVQSGLSLIHGSILSATESMSDFFSTHPKPNASKNQSNPNEGPPTNPEPVISAAPNPSDDDSENTPPSNQRDLVDLTKQLIEVRNILKAVKITNNLVLPSIVVIGSQSSGKSSVLEAIVGQEFLPKGTNMVTRRPLELTLIHSPDLATEYAEFPDLGLPKMTNFKTVQQTLVDLNSAVSDSECVSNQPIELHIHSAKVPDLTLIDLPGYIQIHAKNQPADLKEKISMLCDQYLTEPNIILAVCAADVDLANSEALRASRRVDPLGVRTIGVLTKLDLVTAETGAQLLTSNEYPLQLGYVGVVNKKSAFKSPTSAIARLDRNACVGINQLRSLLMRTLEERMAGRLVGIMDAVDLERSETQYQFKVLYNDRRISAEGYLAETMDAIKQHFKQFAQRFGKPELRTQVRQMLESRILEICDMQYWANSEIPELSKPNVDPTKWGAELTQASSLLTKSGIGRESTQVVVQAIMAEIHNLVALDLFQYHPELKQKVVLLATQLLRSKFQPTVDQVENTIKPYKYELVDTTEHEWAGASKRVLQLMELEINKSQKRVDEIKAKLGRRTMNNMISYLQTVEKEQPAALIPVTDPAFLHRLVPKDERPAGYTDQALMQAQLALLHTNRIQTLWNRVYMLRSRTCRDCTNHATCPEIYMASVVDKLTNTAAMFIYIELVLEFVYQFPRMLDEVFPVRSAAPAPGAGMSVVQFAKQNPEMHKLLDLSERQVVLDLAYAKLRYLVQQQMQR